MSLNSSNPSLLATMPPELQLLSRRSELVEPGCDIITPCQSETFERLSRFDLMLTLREQARRVRLRLYGGLLALALVATAGCAFV